MMRSLYSAVSGLKTHQTKMDVIGNNIANVNTIAFKSTSVTFNDVMYQTTQAAAGSNALTGTGGTNAKQIGLGVTTAAMKVSITSEGAAQSTGEALDLKITGDSFFIVNDGTSNYFTRDGSFYLDGDGNLCMSSTGYNVMGWVVDPTTGEIKKDTVQALRVMSAQNMTSSPEATSMASISGVLDANSTDISTDDGYTMSVTIYDSLGYSYTVKFAVTESLDGTEHVYNVSLKSIQDSDGTSIATEDQLKAIWGNVCDTQTETVTVDAADIQSRLVSGYSYDAANNQIINDSTGAACTTQAEIMTALGLTDGMSGVKDISYSNLTSVSGDLTDLSQGLTYTTTTEISGYRLAFDADNGVFEYIGSDGNSTQTLNMSALGGNFSDITVDFSSAKNYDNGGTSTLAASRGITVNNITTGTGRYLGAMTGVSVSTNGMIYGSYDNGDTILLGQIAVASFANASGLESLGNNCYAETLNSGAFDGIGQDITADGGSISTGQLEMSNVDLSGEFTEMITTQRGFQANSRVITTSDTLLEELINLKR